MNRYTFSLILTTFLLFLLTGRIRIYAQDTTGGGTTPSGEVDINVDVHAGEVWYANWWVWVIGLAVFIIIIVAIVSAGRK